MAQAQMQELAAKRMRNRKMRDQAAGWLFAAPAIIGFVVLTLLPMIFSLYWSMTDFNVFRSVTNFIGLDNYRNMFGSSELYFKDALKATGYYSILNVPASILFSFCRGARCCQVQHPRPRSSSAAFSIFRPSSRL